MGGHRRIADDTVASSASKAGVGSSGSGHKRAVVPWRGVALPAVGGVVLALLGWLGATPFDLESAPASDGSVVGTVRLEGPSPRGTVRFEGSPPERAPVDMSADDYCSEAHRGPVMDQPVRVGENGSLRDVIVFVRSGLEEEEFPVPEEPIVLDQDGCLYHPRVLALRTGQSLLIRNSDATLHNVHVSATKNRGFNIGQPIEGMEATRNFARPELGVDVKCDIHGWMQAYIGVFDHPYFAVTGSDGRFDLDGLPSGEYLVEAWHPTLGVETRQVTVTARSLSEVEFVFRGDDSGTR